MCVCGVFVCVSVFVSVFVCVCSCVLYLILWCVCVCVCSKRLHSSHPKYIHDDILIFVRACLCGERAGSLSIRKHLLPNITFASLYRYYEF